MAVQISKKEEKGNKENEKSAIGWRKMEEVRKMLGLISDFGHGMHPVTSAQAGTDAGEVGNWR